MHTIADWCLQHSLSCSALNSKTTTHARWQQGGKGVSGEFYYGDNFDDDDDGGGVHYVVMASVTVWVTG